MKKNLFRIIGAALVVVLFLTSCAPSLSQKQAESNANGIAEPETNVTLQLAQEYEAQLAQLRSLGGRTQPAEPAEGYRTFASLMTEAWLELGEENSVISPYSMYELLAMLSDCGNDELSAKLLAVLGCADATALDEERARMREACTAPGTVEKFSSYNSLWLNEETVFDENKVRSIEERFEAELFRRDLLKASSMQEIGRWIADKTEGVFGGDSERPAEAGPVSLKEAALINALYFHCGFALGSCPGLRKFMNADGSISEVMFASSSQALWVSQNDLFVCARIVVGPDSILTVLMPAPDTTIAEQDDEALSALLGETLDFELRSLNVKVPYFKLSASQDTSPLLREMGLDDLLEPGALAGLIPGKTGENSLLYIDHSAMTALSSEGIEAAAYSEAIGYLGLITPKEEDLIFDRPFFFALSLGDTILTVGRVDRLQ